MSLLMETVVRLTLSVSVSVHPIYVQALRLVSDNKIKQDNLKNGSRTFPSEYN